MEQIHIAIIDDGINETLYNTGLLQYNIEITSELEINRRSGYDSSLRSHGTTCAAIIRKYSPDAMLSSIKILNDDSKRGMKNQLIKALDWCTENKILLINLSLGTIDYRDFGEIEKAVANANARGLIIVAACNNRNIYTCPASLPDVIGVKCDISGNLSDGEFVYNSFAPDGIEITACGRHSIADCYGSSRTTDYCNSFAVPMITAIVHEIMKRNFGITVENIKEELEKRSAKKEVRTNNSVDSYIDDIKIDIPVIIVYDKAESKAVVTAMELSEFFKKDGYNTVCVIYTSGIQSYGALNLACYSKGGVGQLTECLKNLYSVHNPDVIIIASGNFFEVRDMRNSFEIDIILFFNQNDLEGMKQSYKDENGTKIILVSDSPVSELYKRIIDLYEHDNCCVECKS